MSSIVLDSCRNCCMLPSLGQLPNLKSLIIVNFDSLRTIGAEFYRNDSFFRTAPPFPSLEHLEFCYMPCWQEWDSFEPSAFPQLKHLALHYCPILSKGLPDLPLKERFESWRSMPMKKERRKFWLVGFFSAIWNIWLQRNEAIFQSKTTGAVECVAQTFSCAAEWYDE
ncbi:Putative disease resistance protein [Arachis hypogaea]|nr:Putative disease resistance protein [Arachis hypogaea]